MDDANADPEVSDEEILVVLDETDESWLRVEDIAEELPTDADRLQDRLDDLYNRELLDRDTDDPRGEQWQLTQEGRERATVPESEVETDVEAQAAKTTGVESPTTDEETPDTPPEDPQETVPGKPHRRADDAIEAFDPPGTPIQKDERRTALRQAHEYLRERGSVTREEFTSEVFPDAQGAYDAPDAGWWDDVIRPGLEQLPTVERADDGWRYIGTDEDEPVGD